MWWGRKWRGCSCMRRCWQVGVRFVVLESIQFNVCLYIITAVYLVWEYRWSILQVALVSRRGVIDNDWLSSSDKDIHNNNMPTVCLSFPNMLFTPPPHSLCTLCFTYFPPSLPPQGLQFFFCLLCHSFFSLWRDKDWCVSLCDGIA